MRMKLDLFNEKRIEILENKVVVTEMQLIREDRVL